MFLIKVYKNALIKYITTDLLVLLNKYYVFLLVMCVFYFVAHISHYPLSYMISNKTVF